MKKLTIFSGSKTPSNSLDSNDLINQITHIGNTLDINEYEIWYGGGDTGLMGILPKTFFNRNGTVFAVDAKQFTDIYGVPDFCTTIIKDTLQERQNGLLNNGNIFLCLPGGVGTVSELFDVLVRNDTSKKKQYIIVFSWKDYFLDIENFIKNKISTGFVDKKILKHLHFFKTSKEILHFLEELTDF